MIYINYLYKLFIIIIFCIIYDNLETFIGNISDDDMRFGFSEFYGYFLFLIITGMLFYILLYAKKWYESLFPIAGPVYTYIYLSVINDFWWEGYYPLVILIYIIQSFFLVLGAFIGYFIYLKAGHPVDWLLGLLGRPPQT